MKTRNIMAALLLMVAGLQTAMAQKIILHMPDNQKVEYDILQIDSITFEEGSPMLCPDNHHPHAIDLGLPSGTKWCCCNVGANTPAGYGGYYAWGETYEKSMYDTSTNGFAYIDENTGGTIHYIDIGSNIAGTDYDVAHVRMGAPWHMPSKEQMDELLENCPYQWTQQNGVNGMLVTGPNGGQIFLPAAGTKWWDNPASQAGERGFYSSSSSAPSPYNSNAYSLGFVWSHCWIGEAGRSHGNSVRAVCGGSVPQKLVTSIVLSDESLTLKVNDTAPLTATVLPEDANIKVLTWESSNEAIATVSNRGLVTAVAEGTCTITCSATDGSGVKVECLIVVDNTHGVTDGHEWVDLGLPSGTLWATCNVGANTPEEYGDYFAWGEIEPKEEYTWGNYKFIEGQSGNYFSIYKYTFYDGWAFTCGTGTNPIWFDDDGTFIGDGKTELDSEDDAATVNWGSGWQMPSSNQYVELISDNYTTIEWDALNGKDGRMIDGIKITSKTNGKSIFLPAAGINGDNASGTGNYWSRTIGSDFSEEAIQMYFYGNPDVIFCQRYAGMNVRPVRK